METELCSHVATYLDLINDDDLQTKLDRLSRHKSRIERTFHRSLKELKALQTNAAILTMIPRHIRETASPIASAIEIAKRTQATGAGATMETPLEAIELVWTTPDGAPASAPPDELEKQLAVTAIG